MKPVIDKKHIRRIRTARIWHKYLGLGLAVVLVISSITGGLLAWKKNIDILQPPIHKSNIDNITEWKSIAEIADIAKLALQKHINSDDIKLKKIDVRPSKGIAKVLFNSYWEVQVTGKSGEVKSIARRHSDWIESLHDGSIISSGFKLVSMSLLSVGLLLLSIFGLWLWYGPKYIRKLKRKNSKLKN